MSIVISSGHGKYIRGASGSPVPPQLDEVDEARLVVERVAEMLQAAGVKVKTFHDNTSHDQNTNLNTIVNFHNAQTRDLDVSVHFNAYDGSAHGTECLYITQKELAGHVAAAIANAAGVTNRGAKKRTDLFFLNNTDEPAILIETCFCDNDEDSAKYRANFDAICAAIASTISGEDIEPMPPEPPEPEPPDDRPPVLAEGDSGPHVERVQAILGIPVDGDFGPVTDGGVRGFQSAAGLAADGIVGPMTWDELDALEIRKGVGGDGLSPELIEAIETAAESSAIARYDWRDRGPAPIGYTAGVALAFGLALTWLAEDDPAAQAMAQAERGDANTDALSWYRSQFQRLGMSNSEDGPDTLRHLFVLLLGLGPRESSGRYCEGRDVTADNVSADTAEAGAFQTSWNISSSSSHIEPLLSDYWLNPNGFLETFRRGVNPDSNDLPNYGSGDGAKYQFLSKYAPAFHCMVTAIGLRYLRKHWGPINRSEVELREDADIMLREVQDIVEGGVAPEPPAVPTITITIDPPGSARVVIIGAAS